MITDAAKEAARGTLQQAMREPAARRRPRRGGGRVWPGGWRWPAAVALAVSVSSLVVRGGEQPAVIPVAGVRDLGAKAVRSAETDPYRIRPSPGQWLYVKNTIAPLRQEPEPEVDRDQRITLETWHSLDGKQTALDDGRATLVIHPAGPGITSADLAAAPVTPEQMIARIDAAPPRSSTRST
ncbi:hypothetical protein ACBI99_27155 [Nonomuraea sp. ATR24]|uniref:hypothetical protein n=1 Tax=Nonomuraea sp. ATR24 TaxID=1676744 RepID=UPI0035C06F14